MDRIRKVILMLDSSRAADRGIIQGIMEFAHLRRYWAFYQYSPLFRMPPFSPTQTDGILKRLKKLDADGIIGYIPADKQVIHSIIAKKFPAICLPVHGPLEGLINIEQDENVGIAGAKHLLEKEFKNYAFCGTHDYWSRIRETGFCRCLESAGYTVHRYPLLRERKKKESELNRMALWLKGLPKPIAIMACNDERGADVLEACQLQGLRIPEQAAILGVDNDEMICGLSSPPLSSIELNFKAVGYESAKILDALMTHHEFSGNQIAFRVVRVVTRQSTDILAIQDEVVASAVCFIGTNARRDIHVQDVVNHSMMSIRALQQRFKKTLGHGINQEIRRVRIRQFADTLLKTNLTIYQIAKELEINDAEHISRVFKREMGCTPTEYRKRQKCEGAS